MKTAKKALGIFAAISIFVGVVALGGCGSDGAPTPEQHNPDLANFVVKAPALVCVASCDTDDACQTSCPAPTSGLSCCDQATNMCFTSQTTACPVPQDFSMPSTGPYN